MMRDLDRRTVILAAAVAVVAATGGCSPGTSTDIGSDAAGGGHGSSPADPTRPGGAASTGPGAADLTPLQHGPPTMSSPPPGAPGRLVDRLPGGAGNTVALTIDDGTDSVVVQAYIDLAKATGIRLTFFVTAAYPSWRQHRDDLRPLVDSGQIQLGNHTWDHPDLRKKTPSEVADQLNRCEAFLRDTFGVTGKPFVRPPYGYHSAQTDATAADLGYTTMVMWLGSLGDSSPLTEDQLIANARQWLLPQHVVIGHANLPTVTHVYGQILDILRSRSLQTATLDDAFYGPAGRHRTG
jgi:peptidoglycan-N-acetylmuramic acid deacetylase